MRRGWTLQAAAAALLLATLGMLGHDGPRAIAQTQAQAPMQRGFDYWQPDWMVKELWGPGRIPKGLMVRLLRHTTYMQYGVPPDYDGARTSVAASPETTAAGAKLYIQNCAGCHGRDGTGDGDAENALSPSPALLAYMIRRPIAVDEYLLWTVSDGGAQFQSQMPAFKDNIPREDIWRIIAYMRAGFPEVEGVPETQLKSR